MKHWLLLGSSHGKYNVSVIKVGANRHYSSKLCLQNNHFFDHFHDNLIASVYWSVPTVFRPFNHLKDLKYSFTTCVASSKSSINARAVVIMCNHHTWLWLFIVPLSFITCSRKTINNSFISAVFIKSQNLISDLVYSALQRLSQ